MDGKGYNKLALNKQLTYQQKKGFQSEAIEVEDKEEEVVVDLIKSKRSEETCEQFSNRRPWESSFQF
jgi:hypothetical protein